MQNSVINIKMSQIDIYKQKEVPKLYLSNENIIHIKSEKTEYIQFRRLLEYKDIITHAFSLGKDVNYRSRITTETGEKKKCNENKMLIDYENLCTSVNLDKNRVVKPMQKHMDKVEIVKRKILKDKPDIYIEEYRETDGLITQKKNIILSTTSADCILLLFFDPVTKTIANVHSGWRGTYKQIARKAVKKMQQECNVNPQDLICCICPSIRKCHFEVRKDVKDMFEERFGDLKEISQIIEKKNTKDYKQDEKNIEKRNYNQINSSNIKQLSLEEDEKWNIDTVELNKIMLQKEGLKPENIIDSKLCTVCNSDIMHSYRVEKERFGLETAIIALK